MSDLLQVGGLWKNTAANGDTYLQGKLGPNVRILIFKNKFKTNDNQPDYQIYFAPVEREGEGQPGRGPDPAVGDDFLDNPAPAPAYSGQGQGRQPAPRNIPAPARPGASRAGGTERNAPSATPRPEDDEAPPPLDFETMDPAARPSRPATPVSRYRNNAPEPPPTPQRVREPERDLADPGGDDDDFEDPFAEEDSPPPPPTRPAARPAAQKPTQDRLL